MSDAVKHDIASLVAKAGAIGRECESALDAADALRTRTLQTDHLPECAPHNLAAVGKMLEAFDSHEIRIHQLVAEFHDAEHALVDRIDALARARRTPHTEQVEILGQIAAARQQAMDLHARFLHGFMSLERLWQQWSPADPAVLHHEASPGRKRA